MLTKLREYNLHDNLRLSCIQYNSDEEWLELRKQGIGGSDIGAILKLSKYSSPLKVYKSKQECAEQVDSVNIRKGKALEPLIRESYVKPALLEMGYRVEHPDVMFVNNSCPWLIANLDGIAVPLEPKSYRDNMVIEIKWVSELGEQRWNGDDYCGVPAEYYAQVQHYMCVTGIQKTLVCALFDSTWEMHYYPIKFDTSFVMRMLDTSEHFYKHNMAHHIAPEPMLEIDREDILAELVDGRMPKHSVPSLELSQKCAEYTALKEELRVKEHYLKELADDIVSAYRAGESPEAPFRVKLSTYKRKSFDADGLKKANPKLYEDFLTFNDCLRVYIGK